MKNKLYNKRFSKILVTLCLLLTMVFGSSMSVFAVDLNGLLYFSSYDSNNKLTYTGFYYDSIVSDSPVISYSFSTGYDGSNHNLGVGLVSLSQFSMMNYGFNSSSSLPSGFTMSPRSATIKSVSNFKFYTRDIYGYSQNPDFISSTDYVIRSDSVLDSTSINLCLVYILGLSDSLPDGVTIEGGSDIPSNPEYDSGATATIAPPSGVTYYEYVDTSQSSVTSPTVRKGQLQWNVPDDDSLYIEIYADLTYKEGLFNKKTQVVYPWKTLSNSGLKADINKLLFDRFQAGTDYFSENGLDESAFSSHVVNGYYLRFCKVNDDKTVSYSLWNKISILRDNSLTQIGTASSETGIFDENGNWVNKQIVNSEIVDGGGKLPAFSPGLDDDGNNLPSNNNGLDLDSLLTDSNIFERFIGYLKSAMTSLGELPQYVGQLFSFLPQEIIGLLGFGVLIAIILRIIGR